MVVGFAIARPGGGDNWDAAWVGEVRGQGYGAGKPDVGAALPLVGVRRRRRVAVGPWLRSVAHGKGMSGFKGEWGGRSRRVSFAFTCCRW
jgi:hypothetical protein